MSANSNTNKFTVASAPTITLFSPATGLVGTQVTITGTNLSGATAVRFNGTAASSFVVNSATSLTAIVAAGTTTGLVTMTTLSGTTTSATSFVVRVAPTTVADAYSAPQNVPLAGNVIAQAYTLAVYDAQGRLVQQLAHGQAKAGQAQQLAVPTHAYAPGLYLVRLTTATGTQLLKLIKQ